MDTRYAMALKHNLPSPAPKDWYEQLAAIDGVHVEGHTDRGAQFTANDQAFALVTDAFSEWFTIEEVIERRSL
jgi:hypothetical protein